MTREVRDKKVQSYTTSAVINGLNQIEIAEGKKQSSVVHDALVAYVGAHHEVQISVKRQISMQILSEKMRVLSDISSNLNEFGDFEASFVSFCVNLNALKVDETRKNALVADLIFVLFDIKTVYPLEYDKYVKLGRKLLTRKHFDVVFAEKAKRENDMTKQDINEKKDRKELSIGEYREKYGHDPEKTDTSISDLY
ncbi:MAG: hypothetical protein ACT6FG_05655 [Methanosarcinaceae archaeon]